MTTNRLKFVLVCSAFAMLACQGEPPATPAGSVESTKAALTASTSGMPFSFDAPELWTAPAGVTLTSSLSRTQGEASLAVPAHGYTQITSVPIAWTQPITLAQVSFDLLLPQAQPNPYWYGLAQLHVNCPSKAVNNEWVGQVELTGRALQVFQPVQLALPGSIAATLANGCSDLSVMVVLNVPYDATGSYLLDNLRFGQAPPPAPSGLPFIRYATGTDAFGNTTEEWTQLAFTTVAWKAKLSSLRTESRLSEADGTVSTTSAAKVGYTYNSAGNLTAAKETAAVAVPAAPSGTSHTKVKTTVDSYGNQSKTWSTDSFVVVVGEAKLQKTKSEARGTATDGSVSTTSVAQVTYAYDGAGKLAGATQSAVSTVPEAPSKTEHAQVTETVDVYGNKTQSWSTDSYLVVRGEAKVEKTKSETKLTNIDDRVSTSAVTQVTYGYDGNGKLTQATETAVSGVETAPSGTAHTGMVQTVDAYGNQTKTWNTQIYTVVAGKAKVEKTTTETKLTAADGKLSTSGVTKVTYGYDNAGKLTQATESAVSSVPTSPSGKEYTAITESVDAYGNQTQTWSKQTYTVVAGKAKVEKTASEGKLLGADDKQATRTPTELTYAYASDGKLTGVTQSTVSGVPTSPSGTTYTELTQTVDAYGNQTQTWSKQTYTVVAGEAKVGKTTTETKLTAADGKVATRTPTELTHAYDSKGRATGATKTALSDVPGSPSGATYTDLTTTIDAEGNVTESWSSETYTVVAGQVKADKAKTETKLTAVDGKLATRTPTELTYAYDGEGRVTGATKTALSDVPTSPSGKEYTDLTVSVDLDGNKTETWSSDTYAVVGGQVKEDKTASEVKLTGVDGKQSIKTPTELTYSYGSKGKLTGVTKKPVGSVPGSPSGKEYTEHVQTIDVKGNKTETWTSDTYTVIGGASKVGKTSTETKLTSADGKVSTSTASELDYDYDDAGKLTGVTKKPVGSVPGSPSGKEYIEHVQTIDVKGNKTETWTSDTYTVIGGVSKVGKTSTEVKLTSTDGKVSTRTAVDLEYDYDETGKLTSVTKKPVGTVPGSPSGTEYTELREATDVKGSKTQTWTKDTYKVIGDKAKVERTTSETKKTEAGGKVTVSTVSKIDYTYDGQGKLTGATKTAVSVVPEAPSKTEYTELREATDVKGRKTQTWKKDTYTVIGDEAKVQATTSETKKTETGGKVTVSTVSKLDYAYDEEGNLAGATKTAVSVVPEAPSGTIYTEMKESKDTYGDESRTWTKDTYKVIGDEAKVERTVTEIKKTKVDGKVTTSTISKLDYAYDEEGNLAGATKTAVSEVPESPSGTIYTEMTESRDIYGDESRTWNTQIYTIVGDEAKVHASTSETKKTEVDGKVTTSTISRIDYAYDEEGKLVGATKMAESEVPESPSGTVHTEMTESKDAYGNESRTWTTQTYTVVDDEAKLERTVSETKRTEADGKVTTSTVSKIDYAYDEEGKLAGATKTAISAVPTAPSGKEHTEMTETVAADGSKTQTWNTHTYTVVAGEAKVDKATSEIKVTEASGKVSTKTPAQVTYVYDDQGKLVGAAESAAASVPEAPSGTEYAAMTEASDDSGTQTRTWSTQTYTVLGGQVKVGKTTSEIKVTESNGRMTTVTPSDLSFAYDGQGKLVSVSKTAAASVPTAPSGTTYTEMIEVAEISGTQTLTWSTETYTVVGGQVKVDRTTSEIKKTESSGRLTTVTPSQLSFAYDGEGKLVNATKTAAVSVPVAPSGTTHTEMTTSVDAYGKQKQTWNTDTYTVVAGEAKVGRTVSEKKLTEAGGKVTVSTVSKLDYAYDDQGKLTGAIKTAVSEVPVAPSGTTHTEMTTSVDAYGKQKQTWNTDTYTVVGDEAKLGRTISERKLTEADGKVTTSTVSKIDYAYDGEGKLAGASKTAVSDVPEAPSGTAHTEMTQSVDAYGNQSRTWSTQTYAVVGDEAKLGRTITETKKTEVDGKVTTSTVSKIDYAYDGEGKLAGATKTAVSDVPEAPSGTAHTEMTQEMDAYGNQTQTWNTQIYTVVGDEAKLARTISETKLTEADGKMTTSTVSKIDYAYDEEGKLAGATKTAVSEVPEAPSGISYTEMAQTMDQDGKQTKTWSTETYAIIGGEARKQQTSYESVSLSEVMVTSTSPYSVTYSYDSLGNVTSVTTTNVYALPDPPSGMAYPQYAKMTEDSGRITETWSKPTFEVVVGKVWKVSQVNEIRVEDIDGTVTITNEDVVYCDPANGDFSC